MTLTSGTRLGPYEILSAIGAGGKGEVYRAVDARLGRETAIKVVSERLFDDPAALARLQREARTVASLSHPHIVALHDIGTEQGVMFVVMELLDGEPLDRCAAAAPLAWTRALEIAASVADALAAAHEKGVIHRDLKPQNIFVTRDGSGKKHTILERQFGGSWAGLNWRHGPIFGSGDVVCPNHHRSAP